MASDLVWTNHVEERLRQRGISRNEAWETIRYPEKTQKLDGEKWKFTKSFGTKQVVLVTAVKNGQYILLTSWVKDRNFSNSGKRQGGMSTADKVVWSILSVIGRTLIGIVHLIRNLLTGK